MHFLFLFHTLRGGYQQKCEFPHFFVTLPQILTKVNNYHFSDDNWDDNDAKVVCRMLGFNGEFAKATNGSLYDEVNETFSMNEVDCQGTEDSLENCPHQIISDTDDCDIDEAAGVICEGKTK